ncbi:MAG: hypothetical protein ABEJ78_09340 [Haloferacaceae archaeon]
MVGGLLVVRIGVPVPHRVFGAVRTVGALVRPESTLGTAFLLGGILLLGVFGGRIPRPSSAGTPSTTTPRREPSAGRNRTATATS